jgi:general secretion pathway protein M
MIRDRFDLSAVEPYWHQIRAWWVERSLREQILLGSLAAFGIFGLLLVILSPLRQERFDALADIRDASILEARLRAGGSDLALTGKFRRGTPSAIIADSAAAAQLQVQQVEPQGSDVRVTMADVPFDTVITWIADVEGSSNLRIRTAKIERQGAAGFVSVTLVIGE